MTETTEPALRAAATPSTCARRRLAAAALLALLALLGAARDGAAQAYQPVNTDHAWDYVLPPLEAHCLQDYRLYLPPPPHAMPAGGWPVFISVRFAGFWNTDDVEQIDRDSFDGKVLEAGIAVVTARLTPSTPVDHPLSVWTECDPVPEIPGHGLFHPPGFAPPDLGGLVPYDEPGYPMAEKDAVMLVQHVRHLARGSGTLPPGSELDPEQHAAMALLDHRRIAVHGRSAGAIAMNWAALGPDRRGEPFLAGLGGQYDEPTRGDVAVLFGGAMWWPLYSDALAPVMPHFGAAGHSEEAATSMGDALLDELVAASAVFYEDAALNATLPLYLSYGEQSMSTDYGKNYGADGSGCDTQPFCFDDQGGDGVPPFGIHTAWSGYTWKTLHPERTRVAVTGLAAFEQAGEVEAVPFLGNPAARDDDAIAWLVEQLDALLVEPPLPSASLAVGEKVQGQLGAAGEPQVLAFEATAGSRLTVRAKRKGGELQPTLRLVGPDGAELVAAGDSVVSPKAARIGKVELDASGAYRLEVGDASGLGGDFALSTKARTKKASSGVVIVGLGDGSESFSFEAVTGATAKLVVRAIAPPKALPDVVAGQPADLFPEVALLHGPDEVSVDLTGLVTASKSGRKLVVGPVVLPASGTWTLAVGGAGGSVGYGRVTAKVAAPKSKTIHTLVLPHDLSIP